MPYHSKRHNDDSVQRLIRADRTMNRRPVWIVGVFLASFCWGSHGRSCCSVPSYIPSPQNIIATRRQDTSMKPKVSGGSEKGSFAARTNSYIKNQRKFSTAVCRMNKRPGYFDKSSEEDDETINEEEQLTSKRGVFRRIKDKISNTFGGNKKGDGDQNNDEGGGDVNIGYKPTPLDAIRLRLANAMSNLNFLSQFGNKDEWVVACPKTRVGPGQIVPCVVNGLDIIIFASRDGQRLDAFANACPHLGSPFDLATIERKPVASGKGGRTAMDDGTGDGCVDCIVCPVHRTAFEIQSGNVRGEWCPYPPIIGGVMGYMKPKSKLVKFAVRLRGKNVEVRVATSVKNLEKGDEQADGMKGIK